MTSLARSAGITPSRDWSSVRHLIDNGIEAIRVAWQSRKIKSVGRQPDVHHVRSDDVHHEVDAEAVLPLCPNVHVEADSVSLGVGLLVAVDCSGVADVVEAKEVAQVDGGKAP